jgi:choline dehydrogenase-like flavoprotein
MKYVGTGDHVSGTCKMGPASDSLAVVDQYGKVHGLQSLRVVDASVMPDVIRANTNATTIMIAEKVAEFIKEGK